MFNNIMWKTFACPYLSLRGLTTVYWSACTKPGKWEVIYLCFRGIVTKPGKWEVIYLCVRGIVTKPGKWEVIYLCFSGIVTKPGKWEVIYLCVRGIVTKPGKWEVIYLCFSGIVSKPVPSQESERSYICVLGLSLPSLYQARKVRGHIPVFVF
jgi:hypothetical protein